MVRGDWILSAERPLLHTGKETIPIERIDFFFILSLLRDAYIDQKSEAAANEAAAVAYLEALDKNPNFDQTSACARSAEAYIAEFN